jgi:D-galactarolactone cycloisomerase
VRIVDVHSYALSSELAHPFFFAQPGQVTRRSSLVVEVVTEDGVSGWGEGLCHGLQPPEIARATVDHVLRDLYVGRSIAEIGVLHHLAQNRLRDFGRQGATMSALSAVDIAAWDAWGRSLGRPIHELLGGAHRRFLTPYATGFYRTAQTCQADLVAEACRHQSAGFSALKVKIGFGVEEDLTTLAAIRDAVGPTIRLMADANHAYSASEARRLLRGCEDVDLYWLEEPIPPEDLAGYAELRALGSSVLIAMGESEAGAVAAWTVAQARAADVFQPDIAFAGGFTGMREIAAVTGAAAVRLNPHVWGSAIALAASLQFLATVPTTPISRGAAEPMLEYDSSDHPFRRELIAEDLTLHEGRVAVPDGPGLGVTVDRAALERFAA